MTRICILKSHHRTHCHLLWSSAQHCYSAMVPHCVPQNPNKGTITHLPVHLPSLLPRVFLALALHGKYKEDYMGLYWKQCQRREEEWGETGQEWVPLNPFIFPAQRTASPPLFPGLQVSESSGMQNGQTGIWKKQATGKPEKKYQNFHFWNSKLNNK